MKNRKFKFISSNEVLPKGLKDKTIKTFRDVSMEINKRTKIKGEKVEFINCTLVINVPLELIAKKCAFSNCTLFNDSKSDTAISVHT